MDPKNRRQWVGAEHLATPFGAVWSSVVAEIDEAILRNMMRSAKDSFWLVFEERAVTYF
jgi:hypothetical protein